MMDMNVNTDAFGSASSSLKKHCKIIEKMTGLLIKRLGAVKQEFDDVNYDRTAASAISVKNQIEVFSGKVDTLDKDLRTLESLVNDYANGGYGR